MADFGTPVATQGNIQPGQFSNTLASIYQIREAKARAQEEQQTAAQRTNMAKALDDFDLTQHTGADGTIDMNQVLANKDLRHAAGDAYPDLIQKLSTFKQSQLENKQSLMTVNNTARTGFQQAVAGLRTDPDVVADNDKGRQKVQEAIGQFAAQGGDQARIASIYGPQFENVPKGELAQHLSNLQLQAEDAATQAAKQAPQMQNIGGTDTNVAVQSAGAGEGGGPTLTSSAPIKNTIPPGRQPYTDVYGQVFNYNPQTGNYEPVKGAEGKTPGAAAPGSVEAIKGQTETNFNNVSKNRNAASAAPQQLDQINKADALSQQVSTGAWAAERGKIESGLSGLIPGLATAQDDASKLQLLDKFAERISADSSKVLGDSPSTDAARDSIHRMNANIGYTPEAIHGVLQYARAQTLGMQAKGDAQEAWLKQNGNGITNQHDFETQWRQNYDPIAFQLEAASTPEERTKIVNGLTPEQAKELIEKRQKLRDMGVKIP